MVGSRDTRNMEGGRHAELVAALDTPPALPRGPEVVAPFEPVFYEATPVQSLVAVPAPPVAAPADGRSWRERTVQLPAKWFAGVILTALVVGLLIGLAVTGGDGTSSGSRNGGAEVTAPAASPESTVPAGPAPSPNPTAPAAPTTAPPPGAPKLLLDIRRAEGPTISDNFVLPGGRWVLGYAYDCSGKGGQGDFQVTIYQPDGLPGPEGGVNQRGVKGSSVAAYTTTGERYLGVKTDCVWAIRVTA